MTRTVFTVLLAAASFTAASGIALRSDGDQCKCLNWKETLATKGGDVKCGQGPTGPLAFECEGFYTKFNSDQCVNLNLGEDMGQWCFVPNECQSLNGGAKLNDGVAWKKCDKKDDKMLRHVHPKDLKHLADLQANNDGFLNNLVRFAYPTVTDTLWKDVSPAFGVGVDALKTLPYAFQACAGNGQGVIRCSKLPDVQTNLLPRWGLKKGSGLMAKYAASKVSSAVKNKMKRIVDSGEPVLFDSAEGKDPPFALVWGKELFLVWGKSVESMGKHQIA